MRSSAFGQLRLEPQVCNITRRNGERAKRILGYRSKDVQPLKAAQTVTEKLEANAIELSSGYRL